MTDTADRTLGTEDLEEDTGDSELPRLKLKRRSLKGRVKLCPNCFGEMHLTGSLSGWLLPAEYACEKCSYRGSVALEPKVKEN